MGRWKVKIVMLTDAGLERVPGSALGMTFVVDSTSPSGSFPGKLVAHIRDYRYSRFTKIVGSFCIWSVGPEGYEEVNP